MTRAHRRYVAIEASVGAAFTAVMSLGFALLVFHGRSLVPLRGWDGMIADAIPQTMAGGFMCVAVPTILTRRRLRRGALTRAPGPATRPLNVVARGLLLAAAATCIALALHALLLLGPPMWRFERVVAWKIVYGAIMGLAVAGVAATTALRDGQLGSRAPRQP